MGEIIETWKGAQYTQSFIATEIDSTGARVPSNLSGATITFYALEQNNNILFESVCTITDSVNGEFEFLMTTANTKRAGTFKWKILATYANGQVVPFDYGIFKIEDLG